MPKTTISSADAPAPGGVYSPAVRLGNVVQVSGQGPTDPRTGRLVGTTVTDQTRQVLANIAALLAAAGASFSDVVMLRVYLTERSGFAEMNQVFEEVLEKPYPARTTVFCGLGEGLLVEIDALAVLAG